MKFPFYHCTDEEIEEYIRIATTEINRLISERDFDVHIMSMGITLVQLEKEKQQRSIKH